MAYRQLLTATEQQERDLSELAAAFAAWRAEHTRRELLAEFDADVARLNTQNLKLKYQLEHLQKNLAQEQAASSVQVTASLFTPESDLMFYVNSRKIVLDKPDPEQSLANFLRQALKLTGTKLGCGEGGCGACTVMISYVDVASQKIVNKAVNACLIPLCWVDGMAITTVEGIGNRTSPHPVQERIAKAHGSQCGFCTPGFVMSMYALLRNHPTPTALQIEEALDGNLCRCTGYRPIVTAFKTFANTSATSCPCGSSPGQCCKNIPDAEDSTVRHDLFEWQSFQPYDPTQEAIFPPDLRLHANKLRSLRFSNERCVFLQPSSLAELLLLKSEHAKARLVVGNTELGLEQRFKSGTYPVIINVSRLPELLELKEESTGLFVGASTTWSSLMTILEEKVHLLPEPQTRTFRAILENLRHFSGAQIRNVGSIVGNLVTACPISDISPVMQAVGCSLRITSSAGTTRVVSLRDFFIGYRRVDLRWHEVVAGVFIPYSSPTQYVHAYKVSRRKDDDLAVVCACFSVHVEPGQGSTPATLKTVALSYGGVSEATKLAYQTAALLNGKPLTRDTLTIALDALSQELQIPSSVPGGEPEFRRVLITSLFFKFFMRVQREVDEQAIIDPREVSVLTDLDRGVSHGRQEFERSLVNKRDGLDTVGLPIKHAASIEQATGQATYVDDLPSLVNELHGALVFSAKAHARILSVDASRALAVKGVHAFIDHRNVPGAKRWGPVESDEDLFVVDVALSCASPIGMVVAESLEIAQRAARLVDINYQELSPILSIEEAIAANSFYETRTLTDGDIELGFKEADHQLEGERRVGGQDHFYLEPHGCVCYPREAGEIEVFSSTQNPTKTQRVVASALGVPAHKVVCRVKRIGGGFGGKETRSLGLAGMVAVAAASTKRPVRCVLPRQTDIAVTGGRHPFLARYKVGFKADGRVTALSIQLYNNGGCSLDLSGAVMHHALLYVDGVYKIPNIKATGYVCKTNLASNTAFRGFGAPQAYLFTETWMSDIATFLNLPEHTVRERNMYQQGDRTHYQQPVSCAQLSACWQEVKLKSGYERRLKAATEFNRSNKYKKRGLALIATKLGVGLDVKFLNQAAALVHVYTDGSVALTHAGVEMGQGVHTKMISIAARALGVPDSTVYITDTTTAGIPNTTPSAGSATSDLNGMAVLLACKQIDARLQPYREAHPAGSFKDWVTAAYFDRVNLSANGFYKDPNFEEGFPCNYASFGAACSEVELDTLTGEFNAVQTDLVMDAGASLNPGLDIGQIEGAFMQGVGLYTLEEPLYSPKGQTLSTGPGLYKIPSVRNVPQVFNVSLLANVPNPRAIHSSKSVAEPPLFLGSSVYFALKNAIRAARTENGHAAEEIFRLDSPATVARTRLACGDVKEQAHEPSGPRWNITV
eukprot:m.403672 g.403672  ORF g.403672 m.403672 type:complete len:1401 (-) comp56466_c0_seq14:70-4272(-)